MVSYLDREDKGEIMTTHHLKTLPEYFELVIIGIKTFELRKNDRNFKIGDELILHEYDKDGCGYTGRIGSFIINYILENYDAIAPGYVIIAIKPYHG